MSLPELGHLTAACHTTHQPDEAESASLYFVGGVQYIMKSVKK